MSDDLWGPAEEAQGGLPPGVPPGAILIQGNLEDKDQVLGQYAKLAGRPETTEYARVVADRVSELNAMGSYEVPDEAMGTFGLVADKYRFHGETVKMAAKFEVDEAIEQATPAGLLEIIQRATKIPETMTVLCELFFAMGYSFAQDGALAVAEKEGDSG